MSDYKYYRVPVLPDGYASTLAMAIERAQSVIRGELNRVRPHGFNDLWDDARLHVSRETAAAMLLMSKADFDQWYDIEVICGRDGNQEDYIEVDSVLNFMLVSQD